MTSPHWRVELSPNQAYLGRAFVSLRRHAESITALSPEQWADLHHVMAAYETACRQAFGATMFNWTCLMNNAFKADVPAPHVHWHVWPRYAREVTLAGENFRDPNFAHHYDKSAQYQADKTTLATIAERLRANLPT